jgi:hypothetical protein
MKEIIIAHGWTYLRECTCASPGSIWMRGKNKITLYKKEPRFLLVRVGNMRTTGNDTDLENTLNTFGL